MSFHARIIVDKLVDTWSPEQIANTGTLGEVAYLTRQFIINRQDFSKVPYIMRDVFKRFKSIEGVAG